jgi:hypothetical protein
VPVAMPTALDLRYEMAIDVAIAEAPMLTKLFPIRMVVKSVWESCFIFKINCPVLEPSLAIWSAFILLMEKSAVSEEEKKLDKKMHITSTVNSKTIKTKIVSLMGYV